MDKRQEVIRYIASVEKQLYALFGDTYHAALKLTEVRKAIESGATFSWKGNPAAERKLDRYLKDLSSKTALITKNGIIGSWDKGEARVKEQALEVFGKTSAQRKETTDICEQAVKAHRAKGATGHAYANADREGMNLSTRVWNLTAKAKQELEIIIQNGILEGKSPEEVSRSLRGYLNNPDALYRRVRNKETGELELSQAAKKYHPGQGVYRSAYKNARRLAVTEMNAAYRRAEWESYQNNPLIIGYEIRLSNNHTTTVNGKVKRLVDICDKLAGRYPKTFRWTGWHPHCRCEMVPIFISESDFRERIRARKAGKLKDWNPNPRQEVTQVPKALTDWIAQNEERSKGWQTLPYFVRDNRKSIGTLPVNTYTAEERKFTRARSTAEAMERATQLLSTLYPDIQNTELAALHHYTQQGGNYRQLNKQLDKGDLTDFNKASASLMAKALEGLPKYRGTVYRGAIMKRKDYERLYAGKDEVKHAIFTSSTKTPAVAYRFANYRVLKKTEVRVLFEIQSKNGRDISDISEFNGKFAPEDQREVLFTNGTKFKIVSTDTDLFGTIYVKMREL